LTIQEKREDLFCYSSRSGVWNTYLEMNMKKQYSRYDVMYRYNIGCIRYIYKTEWALHCPHPSKYQNCPDFDLRIKQKNAFYISDHFSGQLLQIYVFLFNVTLLYEYSFFIHKRIGVF